MTDEMLVVAEQNKAAAGAENVQFLERCSPFRGDVPRRIIRREAQYDAFYLFTPRS